MKNYDLEVKAKIAEQSKLYFEAWQNKDLESTLSFLDDDFINMFSLGMNQTKEECREDWKRVFDTYSIEGVEFIRTELIVDNNYAFETGLFKQKWITNDKQDTISFDMRGMTVYKKQSDESWKMFRLMGQQ
jgi:ketosteroid isomerase-like protein